VRDLLPLPEENLLDNGFTASNLSSEPALLNEDRDIPEMSDNISDNNVEMHMTVDNDNDNGGQEDTDATTNPLCHQCKTARRTSFVDHLVSVSNDSTFGTYDTSPSPHVGHLTDHVGLSKTFSGSRIKMSMQPSTSQLVCHSIPTTWSVSPVPLSTKS
jgi:hypothetical protein